jgi:hypothetical protein
MMANSLPWIDPLRKVQPMGNKSQISERLEGAGTNLKKQYGDQEFEV